MKIARRGLVSLLFWILAASAAAADEAPPETLTVYGTPETVDLSVATKTSLSLMETPQAVSVIPRALLDDQNVRTLNEALKNVSGVNYGGYFGEWDYYRIRGFDVSYYYTYMDGLIGESAPTEEMWGLERVEVVKGPASTLYGQGPLGGFVNLVSKRPKPEFFAETQVTGASDEYYEAAVDVNGSLNDSGTLYGRFNGLYRNNESFVDYANSERIYIAPSLTWEIGPETMLTFLTSFKDDDMDLAFPLPAVGTVLPNPNGEIPISRYIGNPAYGNDDWERTIRAGYEFTHSFTGDLSFRQNFRFYRLDFEGADFSYPAFLDTDDRTLALSGYRNNGHYDGVRVDSAVEYDFAVGPSENVLIAGTDYRESDTYFNSQDGDLIFLDLFEPDYDALPAYTYGPAYEDEDSSKDLGFYAQIHSRLYDRFTLTLGGRYDRASYESTFSDFDKNEFTPKVGLTYELRPDIALYTNYSKSFEAQWFNTDATGDAVDPETGRNIEVGLKGFLLDGRLNTLIALYQLTRKNVATDNVSTPDPFDSIVSGEQRSRGLEMEGTFLITPGWNLTAAYTYIDAEITEDNVLPVGSRLAGVPDHTFNAWTRYTWQSGPLAGFGLGLGGHYYTDQEGDASYTEPFTIPSYGVMDTAVYYDRGPWHLQVNLNNVLDEEYFLGGSYDRLYVLPGAPRNVRASLSYSF